MGVTFTQGCRVVVVHTLHHMVHMLCHTVVPRVQHTVALTVHRTWVSMASFTILAVGCIRTCMRRHLAGCLCMEAFDPADPCRLAVALV